MPAYGEINPPSPALTFGDSPWYASFQHERLSGVLRGIKIFNKVLSESDMLAEAAADTLVTNEGQANIWYMNINPTPNRHQRQVHCRSPPRLGRPQQPRFTLERVSAAAVQPQRDAAGLRLPPQRGCLLLGTHKAGVRRSGQGFCRSCSETYRRYLLWVAVALAAVGLFRAYDSGLVSIALARLHPVFFGSLLLRVHSQLRQHRDRQQRRSSSLVQISLAAMDRARCEHIFLISRCRDGLFADLSGHRHLACEAGIENPGTTRPSSGATTVCSNGKGKPDSYWGAHPYPDTGAGDFEIHHWEIATDFGGDIVDTLAGTRKKLVTGAWFTQGFRAWRSLTGRKVHRFYIDLPSLSAGFHHRGADRFLVWQRRSSQSGPGLGRRPLGPHLWQRRDLPRSDQGHPDLQ